MRKNETWSVMIAMLITKQWLPPTSRDIERCLKTFFVPCFIQYVRVEKILAQLSKSLFIFLPQLSELLADLVKQSIHCQSAKISTRSLSGLAAKWTGLNVDSFQFYESEVLNMLAANELPQKQTSNLCVGITGL